MCHYTSRLFLVKILFLLFFSILLALDVPCNSPCLLVSLTTQIVALDFSNIQSYLRLPYTFKGRFFSKKIFTAKLNITSLPSFSKKNYFKILKRARVINKNVFSSETLYPPESYKPIKMCQRHDFLGRFSRQKIQGISFHVASLAIVYACNMRFIHTKFSLVLVFTSPICKKKERKKSLVESKEKTGPKKKKKKVFDDEWRKTLADNDKVIMGVMGLTQLLSTCNAQFRVWLELVYLLGIWAFWPITAPFVRNNWGILEYLVNC